MQEFIIVLSVCNFRNIALKHILSGIFMDREIITFTSPEQMNRWNEQTGENMSLSVYIILPDAAESACSSIPYFEWLVSTPGMVRSKPVSKVTVLYESEVLPGLLRCACEYYGYRMMNIRKLSCNEISEKIVFHHEGKKSLKKEALYLTDREAAVLEHILNGCTLRDISGMLNVSMKTIYSFNNNIRKKLGLNSGLICLYRETIRESIRNGIVILKQRNLSF